MKTVDDAEKETEVLNKQSVEENIKKETSEEKAREDVSGKENKGKFGKIIKRIAVIAGVLFVIALAFWVAGRLSISVVLAGEPECTLEFGEYYIEKGATAKFGGRWIFPQERQLKVTRTGDVDTAKVGTYHLTYHANYLMFASSAVRTVHVIDTKAPEIRLITIEGSYTIPGEAYEEEGYTAYDNADGDITDRVKSYEEDGIVYYSVTDSSGNKAETQRVIYYHDPVPPEITLWGDTVVTLEAGESFTDPGFNVIDNLDGDLSSLVTVTNNVDPYLPGEYTVDYTVEDSDHNVTTVSRKVVVKTVRQSDGVTAGDHNIYLTFDDGPGKFTQQLLDTLEKYNVKATFFVVSGGNNSLIAKEAAAGHSVGVHSATHKYKEIYASEDAYFADLQKMNDIIKEQTGSYTKLVRFPGGSSNTVSKFNPGIMTRLAEALGEKGYQYFDWNVDSNDAGGSNTPGEVFDNVIKGVKGRKNSVVLMHDIKGYSVEAVERIVVWGIVNGYTFLPLDVNSPSAHHGIKN